ncbi:ceramide glucosyltransferase [Niveomyces insectorum RCEF 264]|uniref:Ceramide glucosyltransferase n=1 Tax=Niveomyces insectorum RCEF 264 TaxID=1081102 RepID=A0A167S4B6_9HYPO|nr:ceramide glucosyltransferase [Niveomyces insectorum RCEF 264]
MTPTVTQGLACICGTWSCFVFLVQGIGLVQLFRNYARPPAPAAVEFLPVPGDDHDDHDDNRESDQLDLDDDDRNSLLPNDIHNDADDPDNPNVPPHVTVIRPVKGLEPELYACLASTFRQSYPPSRLSVALCVESRADPAWPVLARVVADHPHVDARIYVEAEDPRLHGPGAAAGRRLGRQRKEGVDVDNVVVVACHALPGLRFPPRRNVHGHLPRQVLQRHQHRRRRALRRRQEQHVPQGAPRPSDGRQGCAVAAAAAAASASTTSRRTFAKTT